MPCVYSFGWFRLQGRSGADAQSPGRAADWIRFRPQGRCGLPAIAPAGGTGVGVSTCLRRVTTRAFSAISTMDVE